MREILYRAQAETSASSDGSIVVDGGGALQYPERSVLLELLGDVRARVAAALGPAFFPASSRLKVVLRASIDGTDPETRHAFVAPPGFDAFRGDGGEGGIAVTLAVRNPEDGLDARVLVARAVEGLLGAAVVADGGSARNRAPNSAFRIPRWFSAGLARTFDLAARQEDFDKVRAGWARGMIPPVRHLATVDSAFAEADEALAAELVSWWLSFPDAAARWEALRGRIAAGEPWTPKLFFETASRDGDEMEADRNWDAWLISRRRTILSPGVTTRAAVARALSILVLRPGLDGVPEDFAASPQPLVRLLEKEARPWRAAVAGRKAQLLARESIGRGDAFRNAAAEIAEVLGRLAEGKAPGKRDAVRLESAMDALSRSAAGEP